MSRPVVVPIPERLAAKPFSVTTTQPRTSRRKPDRDETKPGLRSGLSLELIRPHLLNGHDAYGYPHDLRALQGVQKPTTAGNPHPSRQSFGTTRRVRYYGSHLGSTLKPGGAVLTRGVFGRSGSVACIRVDASPNEVHTRSIMHDRYDVVNVMCAVFPNLYAVITWAHKVQPASGLMTRANRAHPRGRSPSSTSATTKSAT